MFFSRCLSVSKIIASSPASMQLYGTAGDAEHAERRRTARNFTRCSEGRRSRDFDWYGEKSTTNRASIAFKIRKHNTTAS